MRYLEAAGSVKRLPAQDLLYLNRSFREAAELMTKRPKANVLPAVIGGACFLAGVVLTLLWTSFSRPSPQAQESSLVFNDTSDAFSIHAQAWRTSQELPSIHKIDQTGSLSRNDMLIAIPSSLARSATAHIEQPFCWHLEFGQQPCTSGSFRVQNACSGCKFP